ncbi:MAG: TetR/AcrR family transcriptional regulator [Deltaproteobacteria bacterium]|nr:TetR/AcrR family transcriptional regulator [Deltaproteobacteria bacterium]
MDWQRTETRDKNLTRERIIESAMRAFAEQGYHDTSMDDIVRRSGFSKGAIYFHFPGKEALFYALVSRLADALEAAARSSIEQERGAVARVDAALQTLLGMISRHPRLARVVLASGGGLGPSLDPHLMKLHERFARFIKEYLDKAVQDGSLAAIDTEVVAYAWLGAIKEIVIRWLRARNRDPLERVICALRVLLLRSIGIEVSGAGKAGKE